MSENRHQRIDAVIPVQFADAREFLVEYTSNISLGGVFVRTSSPAAYGTVVRLSLELPGSGQSVPVTGQVAFVLPADQAAREGKVPGMGVRFTRLDPAVQETLANYVSGLQRQTKGRVLLVDDDAMLLQQLADMLRARNLNVTTVSSAVKALEIIRFGGIDFIISDINMPRMDGFEFRDNLRNNPKTSSIPFVFLTASLDESDQKIAEELGVRQFLVKPVQEEQLVGLLRQVLGDAAFHADGQDGSDGEVLQEAESKAARKRQQQRRIVDIAYRKFVALGLDTRFTADEAGIYGQLAFKTVNIQDPSSGARLDRAGLYNVGHDKAKPFWPRALGALPMIPILDLPDGAALEREIAKLFQHRLEEARTVKQFLDRFKIQNRYDPTTLRVVGHVRIGMDEMVFSVRDQKTLFLERINGRSLGAVAAVRARQLDISDCEGGVDVEIAIETAAKRLQEEMARLGPEKPARSVAVGAGGAMENADLGDLSGPDPELAPAAAPPRAPAPPVPAAVAPPPAAPAPMPGPASAPAETTGFWLGESEEEEVPAAVTGSTGAGDPFAEAPPAPLDAAPEEGLLLGEPLPDAEEAAAAATAAAAAPEPPPLFDPTVDPFAEAAAPAAVPAPAPESEPPAPAYDPSFEVAPGPAEETADPLPAASAASDEIWPEAPPPEASAPAGAASLTDFLAAVGTAPPAADSAPLSADPTPPYDPAIAGEPAAAAPVEDEAAVWGAYDPGESGTFEPVETAEPTPSEATPAEYAFAPPETPGTDPGASTSAPDAPTFDGSVPEGAGVMWAPDGGTADGNAPALDLGPDEPVDPTSVDLGGFAPEPEPQPDAAGVEIAAGTFDAYDARAFDFEADPDAAPLELDVPPAPATPHVDAATGDPAETAAEATSDPVPVATSPQVPEASFAEQENTAEPETTGEGAVPAEDREAREWADEWTADERDAAPLWSVQPDEVPPPEANGIPDSLAPESSRSASPEAAPADAQTGTPMLCNGCGVTYMLGDDVEDERLLLHCPDCVAKQG